MYIMVNQWMRVVSKFYDVALRLLIAVFVVVLIFFSPGVFAFGEKYAEQGKTLSVNVARFLDDRGYCHFEVDCLLKFPMYGEDGNRVNLSFYGVQDKSVISLIIEYVARDGFDVTNNTPITLRFYYKSKKELLGVSSIFVKPDVVLEVNR